MKNTISVIIPTKNRSLYLYKVLPSYLIQKNLLEIIIVDDGSTDNTDQLVREFKKRNTRVVYIRNKESKGAPACRNIGVSKSKGEYIYFGEDDLFLDQDCFSLLLEHLRKNNADIIAGRRIWMQQNESFESSLERADKLKGSPINESILTTDFQKKVDKDIIVPLLDASMLIKKEVFSNVTYEEYYYPNSFREESDFQISACEKGYMLIFCPHVLTYHLFKDVNKGGNHSQNIIHYETSVIRNNYYFYKKHQKYFKKILEHHSEWRFFILFVIDRLIQRNIFPAILRTKKYISKHLSLSL